MTMTNFDLDEEPLEPDELDRLANIEAILTQLLGLYQQTNMALMQLAESIRYTGRPKRVVRGPDGRAIGVE